MVRCRRGRGVVEGVERVLKLREGSKVERGFKS